ncbi:phytanoyl-CoA dioxygenase family protein [Streptomyces sp. NPDC057424]|uniref:phytanoyl-CoA dioxygenase family protein n=1 Tax=Streptomyces sp. NPDC057424 TaxID=3346127 RepID=UPI0036C9D7E7
MLRDAASLYRRYREDGYLYLRGVLDPDELLRLRAAYFARFGPGYLKTGTSAEDGIFSGHPDPGFGAHGVPGHPAHAFVRSEVFDRFTRNSPLSALSEILLQGPAELLPRRIVRHFSRGTRRASRAHTDFDYLSRGSDQFVTCWIPIGPCPLSTGGIIYLEGSHQIGPDAISMLRSVTDRPEDPRPISHDLDWVAHRLRRRWLWADYAVGDVAIHSPYTVHATLDTETEVMRLSTDIRFIRRGEMVDERWTHPWSGDDGS